MDNSSFLKSRKIGVIGFGMFGKFLCEELLKDFEVNIYSPHFKPDLNKPNLKQVSDLKELAEASDFIIPCVPISKFENLILELKPLLKENTILMDVCSVKEYPVEIMKKHITADVQIISTHPLFGPKPFEKRRTLKGSRMVVSNITAQNDVYLNVVAFFKSLEIEVIEMDAKDHDLLMARSQFFTQLVRHAANKQELHATQIDTPAAELLFEAIDNIGTSENLLIDMLKYNHYCQEVLYKTISTLTELKNNKINTDNDE